MQAVPAAEQSEQVRRVIGRHRQAAGFRVGAGQDGRQGEARVPADGARVAEPGGAIGQRRKIGVQRAVNPAGTVEEGGERELIEDDDHHRWGGDEGDTVERPLPIGRRQEASNGRMEQEHRRHDHRCRGKERGEEADRREPDVANDGERAAGRRRRQRGHAAPVCKLPDGRERDGGDEPADDDHGCAPPPAGGEAPGQAECEEAADRAGPGRQRAPAPAGRQARCRGRRRTRGYPGRMSKTGCATARLQSPAMWIASRRLGRVAVRAACFASMLASPFQSVTPFRCYPTRGPPRQARPFPVRPPLRAGGDARAD